MKYCIVIGDGMADHPVAELGGRTPLEAADIPVMDGLAAQGAIGLARTVPLELPAGSDTAILSICGYDPRLYYTGRAPLEAAGADVPLEGGDVAYRCNMVTLEDGDMSYAQKRLLSHNGGSVDGESSMRLAGDLSADPAFAARAAEYGVKIYPTPSFRHIAVQRGADIAGFTAAPPHDHLDERINRILPSGGPAEGLNELMRLAHEFLDKHPINEARRAAGKLPANGIWFWAEGTVTALPSFASAFGKSGFVVSAVPLVWGIGALAGLDRVKVPGATGELNTDFEGKADAALRGLAEGYDFALLHLEAPDECTHVGDLKGKLQAIEWLDSRMISRLKAGLERAGEPYRLLIISDHLTLTETRGHNGDPVPFILYDSRRAGQTPGGRAAAGFSEPACAAAGLFVGEGHTMIAALLNDAGGPIPG